MNFSRKENILELKKNLNSSINKKEIVPLLQEVGKNNNNLPMIQNITTETNKIREKTVNNGKDKVMINTVFGKEEKIVQNSGIGNENQKDNNYGNIKGLLNQLKIDTHNTTNIEKILYNYVKKGATCREIENETIACPLCGKSLKGCSLKYHIKSHTTNLRVETNEVRENLSVNDKEEFYFENKSRIINPNINSSKDETTNSPKNNNPDNETNISNLNSEQIISYEKKTGYFIIKNNIMYSNVPKAELLPEIALQFKRFEYYLNILNSGFVYDKDLKNSEEKAISFNYNKTIIQEKIEVNKNKILKKKRKRIYEKQKVGANKSIANPINTTYNLKNVSNNNIININK